ncbi:Zn-ribbon domain-containing OB-fold protein [Actinomadura geliboluensis]|uniref:Zn-ribbon domain-containing OB-fold protein n=1 Tax=Actinomadura geliboluensis TaxID=882440 RepID=UPI003716230B
MTAVATGGFPAGPAADRRDLAYWEALREGRLVVQRCGACGTWLPGSRIMCSRCHGFDVTWRPAAAKGRVFTWCRTHYPYMSELADLHPYVSVVVELPDAGGVRVLGMLAPDSADVRIGDAVAGAVVTPPGSEWPVLRWTREPVGAEAG